MGKKYPAGMGMVVARISIQNCREVGSTWQELEANRRAYRKGGMGGPQARAHGSSSTRVDTNQEKEPSNPQ